MQELVRVVREVVIDDNIDTLDVDTTSEQVCRNEDPSIELLERFVLRNAFLLLLSGMNADRRKVALGQQTVQFVSTGDLADEDDNLIELKGIEQVVELSVFLGLGKLDVVELQSMESQLSIVVDVDLHRVLAKLLAYRTDFLAESGTEHHHLFLMWGHAEDLLHVTTHVKSLKDAIALVQDEMLDMVQLEGLLPGQSEDTPAGGRQGALVWIHVYLFDEDWDVSDSRGADNNVRAVVLQNIAVRLNCNTAVKNCSLDLREVFGETLVFVGDLECQLPGMTENKNADLVLASRKGVGIQLVKSRQYKYGRLSHPGLCLAYDVHSENGLRNALMLHLRGMLKTAVHDGAETFWL